ncbi:MAG: antibiotic biosynthesis monooxygenase [Cytophagales bacterium]|nr:antibiotic biosynthesis monooxygenase [Cytophagales bacterium]
MNNQAITVVYKWTAKPGHATALKATYHEVTNQMQANEPDALQVACYFEEATDTLVVYDLFKDGAALGFHLSTTAAGHFPALLEIAVPGPFLFCGDVPEQLQQAAKGMGLDATFAPRVFGFDRALVEA